MRFVSVREMRNNPGRVWEAVRDDDVVLTANGKPMGLLISVSEEGLVETAMLIRRLRAQEAVSALRRSAAQTGAARLTDREIQDEVRRARAARKRR